MAGAMQLVHALYREQVRSDAAYLCAHVVEHPAQLLYVWFAGGVIYSGVSFGKHGSHYDVCRSCHRSLVEQHVCAFQPLSLYLERVVALAVHELCPQILESEEMRVQSSSANLVTSRLSHNGLSEACQQRSYHQHAATQRCAFAYKLLAVQIVEVYFLCTESIVVLTVAFHSNPDVLQQENQVVHVKNVRHIVNAHLFVGKQRGTNHLQRLVFGTLWSDCSTQRMAAFYDKRFHSGVVLVVCSSFSFFSFPSSCRL